MWLLELIGISLVAGTVLGVSWRALENWWDKGEAERLAKKVATVEVASSSTNKPE